MVLGAEARTTDGLTSFQRYHGCHVDAGAAAEVQIRDGSASGTILETVRLGAAGTGGKGSTLKGIATAGGVFVEVVSGTPTVTVYGI